MAKEGIVELLREVNAGCMEASTDSMVENALAGRRCSVPVSDVYGVAVPRARGEA